MATRKPKTPPRDLVANPLTVDEKIAEAFEQAKKYLYDSREHIPEPTYQFAVGEPVFYGNLHDCKVVESLEGGRYVLIDYHNKGEIYGKPFDKGRAYRIIPWVSVRPKSTVKDTSFARKRQIYGYSQTDLGGIIHRKYDSGFWDDVQYQRDYVWTMEDKIRLLDSLFNCYDIGKIVFVRHPWPENRWEVLDGKQRLNAIADFMEGRYPYKGYFWNELSFTDRHTITGTMIQYVDIDANRLSVADRLDIFLSLNRGGVPQTEEHIAKVQAMFEEELKKENDKSK